MYIYNAYTLVGDDLKRLENGYIIIYTVYIQCIVLWFCSSVFCVYIYNLYTLAGDDLRRLENGVHVVSGTPGRVFDMIKRRSLRTRQIKVLVLDEADEMLGKGFKEQIYDVYRYLPPDTQVGSPPFLSGKRWALPPFRRGKMSGKRTARSRSTASTATCRPTRRWAFPHSAVANVRKRDLQ